MLAKRPGLPSEEFLSPVGRLIKDLGKLRGALYTDLSRLPAADPMKKILADIDGLLEKTETDVMRVATRTGRFGPDPLKYFRERMAELERALSEARAIEVPPGQRRLPPPKGG